MPRTSCLAIGVVCAIRCDYLLRTGGSGYITGVVRDSSGAVIPGASVRAFNTATNVNTRTESNEQGVYTLSLLQAGNYNIRVDKQGFKAAESNAITVRVNDRLNLDLVLEIGEITEKVTVKPASLTGK